MQAGVRRQQPELIEVVRGRVEVRDLPHPRDVLDGVADVVPAADPHERREAGDARSEPEERGREPQVHRHRLPPADEQAGADDAEEPEDDHGHPAAGREHEHEAGCEGGDAPGGAGGERGGRRGRPAEEAKDDGTGQDQHSPRADRELHSRQRPAVREERGESADCEPGEDDEREGDRPRHRLLGVLAGCDDGASTSG